MLQAEIKIKGVAKVQAAMDKIRDTCTNPTPLLRSLDLLLKQQVGENFAKKRDPVTGRPWKATSAATLAVRASNSGGTMYATGALQRNIIGRPPIIMGNSLIIGSDLIYAVALQGDGRSVFTIRPKHSRYLARPITREAARAGSARRWCELNAGRFFIRYNTIFLKTLAGPVASWALMDHLDLTPRPFVGMGESQGRQAEKAVVRFIQLGIAA